MSARDVYSKEGTLSTPVSPRIRSSRQSASGPISACVLALPDRPGVYRISPHSDAPSREVGPEHLAALAHSFGLCRLGITSADPISARAQQALQTWLSQGFGADMAYLSHPERHRPRDLLPEAQSVLVVALMTPSPKSHAPIAAYAGGQDYHFVLKQKLLLLAQQWALDSGRTLTVRPCVDTAPLLERELAERAGLGFTGKSTLTIAPGLGTRVLLGELLVDAELPHSPARTGSCGQCTRCLDACPTQAFAGPYLLDARRCIAYLTIEQNGPIPPSLRRLIGERIFGCDVCQAVCPYNATRRAPPAAPELDGPPPPPLETILEMGSSAYRRWVAGTALRRVSRTCMQRNAAVALGNRGAITSIPVLAHTLVHHRSPLVRAHAAWALGCFTTKTAISALESAIGNEPDSVVRDEIEQALAQRHPERQSPDQIRAAEQAP